MYCVILFRPSSSRCIFSNDGTTAAMIWKTMLAEMYGTMPSANTVARERPPPVNRS